MRFGREMTPYRQQRDSGCTKLTVNIFFVASGAFRISFLSLIPQQGGFGKIHFTFPEFLMFIRRRRWDVSYLNCCRFLVIRTCLSTTQFKMRSLAAVRFQTTTRISPGFKSWVSNQTLNYRIVDKWNLLTFISWWSIDQIGSNQPLFPVKDENYLSTIRFQLFSRTCQAQVLRLSGSWKMHSPEWISIFVVLISQVSHFLQIISSSTQLNLILISITLHS